MEEKEEEIGKIWTSERYCFLMFKMSCFFFFYYFAKCHSSRSMQAADAIRKNETKNI